MRVRLLWRVGLGALTVASLACSDSDDDASYSEDLRRDFVSDCTTADTDRPLCECVYDAFEAEVPFSRFQELDEALRDRATADIPEDIQEMVVACAVEAEDS